jgi:hypothetical protein
VEGSSRQELRDRIEAIEEAYEFMLAYAAQGLSSHEASRVGAQIRDFLKRAEEAIDRLADLFAAVTEEEGQTSNRAYSDFIEVIRDDARKAGAAMRLASSQQGISSQLIDNLNASIHIRALLTDVFLLDEIIEPRSAASTSA